MTPGLPHAVSCARHTPAPLFEALTLLRQDSAADQTAHHLVMEHAHNPETRMLIDESVLFSMFPLSKQSSLPAHTVCKATVSCKLCHAQGLHFKRKDLLQKSHNCVYTAKHSMLIGW